MKFFNPHLSNWFAPKTSDIEKVLEIIQNPENQPVFIHCKRGADRTGTVVAVYRMKYENWTDKQANKEAKEFGLGWWQIWMKDYIHDYYRDLKK
jgi:protein tyrosine/serine phosphatase